MTEELTLPQEDALALLRAATNISQAREKKDKAGLAIALDENMQLWTIIQTVVGRDDNPLASPAKKNLLKLANFVIARTLKYGCDASEETLNVMENMNLQIAEGLLETEAA